MKKTAILITMVFVGFCVCPLHAEDKGSAEIQVQKQQKEPEAKSKSRQTTGEE